MRFGVCTLAVFAAAALVACGDDAAPANEEAPAFSLDTARMPVGERPSAPAEVKPPTAPVKVVPVNPSTLSHPEVVYLIMAGKDTMTWFCTGALISKDVVVTAAHCLQSELFLSWEVVAPTLPNRPRVKATKTAMFDTKWKDVAHPDIGIVKLETGIDLPQYAELIDVSTRVEGGEALSTETIVRTKELPEAPLQKSTNLKLSLTTNYGYDNGFGVPIYSHGGDSGAGMFLIENGKMTHKIVGIEREPDPARKLDHLTRVEADFIQWTVTAAK